MAGPTWTPMPFNLGSVFGAVPKIDRYQRIYDFLNDRAAVETELRAIDQATTTRPSFRAYLERWEKSLGFSADVKTIHRGGTKDKIAALLGTKSDGNKYVDNEDLIGETAFLQILASKRPMVDLGVQPDHGTLTHRVQWVMIGMWDQHTRRLGVGEYLADLYQGMASGNARIARPVPVVGGKTEQRNLWDTMFDSFNQNATHPEYLHYQFVRTSMPRLFDKWD
jgi:Family of unknown function (DUF5636)